MPKNISIRLTVIAAAAIACGVLVGSNLAHAAPREDNCRPALGADRATCCSKVESTTILGRLFGGGCTIVSRGDLGHDGQQASNSTRSTKSSGRSESGTSGGNGNNGSGNTVGNGDN